MIDMNGIAAAIGVPCTVSGVMQEHLQLWETLYCNQAALKERQKYWKAAEIAPGSAKVASQLHQLGTDSDELLTQIQKQAGDDFLIPHPLWFEDFLADEDAQS